MQGLVVMSCGSLLRISSTSGDAHVPLRTGRSTSNISRTRACARGRVGTGCRCARRGGANARHGGGEEAAQLGARRLLHVAHLVRDRALHVLQILPNDRGYDPLTSPAGSERQRRPPRIVSRARAGADSARILPAAARARVSDAP